MENTEDIEYEEEHPCRDCSMSDACDGWESQFCCTLCMYLGIEHCDDCNPMDI